MHPVSDDQDATALHHSNRLLSSMPEAEWQQVSPLLDLVRFGGGDPVYKGGRRIDHLYFPIKGCVALVIEFRDGFQAEVGLVGFEGMIGAALAAGARSDIASAIALTPCEMLHLSADAFRSSRSRLPGFRTTLLRYVRAMLVQSVQHAACNGHHDLQARVARCVLTLADRYGSDELPVNQYVLASLLSTYRPSISNIAKRWQQMRIIEVFRGRIRIVNRAAMQRLCCECYGVITEAQLGLR